MGLPIEVSLCNIRVCESQESILNPPTPLETCPPDKRDQSFLPLRKISQLKHFTPDVRLSNDTVRSQQSKNNSNISKSQPSKNNNNTSKSQPSKNNNNTSKSQPS